MQQGRGVSLERSCRWVLEHVIQEEYSHLGEGEEAKCNREGGLSLERSCRWALVHVSQKQRSHLGEGGEAMCT